MKIATWNVNSLKIRLDQIVTWISQNSIDVLCLQETKILDEKFPKEIFEKNGYQVFFSGQKRYNGVAILSKYRCKNIIYSINGFDKTQKRFLALDILSPIGNVLRVVCIYCPNGESVSSDKYIYKLEWLDVLYNYLNNEIYSYPYLAMLGDYNIAPENIDVYDPKSLEGHILFSIPERNAFKRLISIGFLDAFRFFKKIERSFSWWDYRRKSFQKNFGCRIDHILLSKRLFHYCVNCIIDKSPRSNARPSDHAPVVAELIF